MKEEFKEGLAQFSGCCIGIIAALIVIWIIGLFTGCTSSKPIDKQIIYVTDTTCIKKLNDTVKTTEEIRRQNIELYAKLDSIQNINDSLNTDIVYLKFKIERIRYYNDIARKGNNIKFLRGWINRVINE